jgi:hypothetical protein
MLTILKVYYTISDSAMKLLNKIVNNLIEEPGNRTDVSYIILKLVPCIFYKSIIKSYHNILHHCMNPTSETAP